MEGIILGSGIHPLLKLTGSGLAVGDEGWPEDSKDQGG